MKAAYITIHDKIKEQIDNGIWKIGQRLPSERDLADEFGVSRMTLRQGITLLVEEGILQRKIGFRYLCRQYTGSRKDARHDFLY